MKESVAELPPRGDELEEASKPVEAAANDMLACPLPPLATRHVYAQLIEV